MPAAAIVAIINETWIDSNYEIELKRRCTCN